MKTRWLEGLEGLLRAARCYDLDFVHMNWKETSGEPPFWAAEQSNWSQSDYNEFVQRHRRRQRTFTRFFDAFTCNAPNITKLILPFDWSSRSLEALGRLTKLHSLVLEKYFVFQSLINGALCNCFGVYLTCGRLILEVWTPSGKGLILYSMRSAHLEYLDISQSRGFYISELTMHALKIFKVSRHPWNGPLTCALQYPHPLHTRCTAQWSPQFGTTERTYPYNPSGKRLATRTGHGAECHMFLP